MKKTFTRLAILCLTLSTGSLFAQLTPEVLYYKFDGTGTTVPNLASAPPVGTTTANILGGITQGGSGICRGTLIGSGVASSTDYLNTGWAPNLGTGSWTISFRPSGISTNTTLYYIFGDINSNSLRCFTNGVAGSTNWILRGGGLTDVYCNGGALATPTMVTYVYDNTLNNVKAYLNGVLVSTVAQTAPNLTGTGPFKVMGYSSNVGAPAGGMLDEFRVYSHALNAAEVAQLYNPYATVGFLGADQLICPGNTTAIQLAWPASTVSWSTGSTNDSIHVTTAGTYSVTVSGTCGSGTDAITLNSAATTNSFATISCGNYTAPSGAIYTASATFNDTIPNAALCDSVITITLTVNQPSTSTISPFVCTSTYTAPSGATYTVSGTYTDIIPNSVNCDSTITINLTIASPTTSAISASACDMYMAPSGAMFTSSGTVTDIIPNAAGCDSTITIQLTITNSSSSTMSASACDVYTAPSGATFTSSGTVTDIIPNAAGCDSTITINLTITNGTSSTFSVTACDSYTAPSGATFTTGGPHTDIIPNAAGCDSTISINLTLNNSSTSSMNASSCGPYTAPSGAVFTSSGTVTDIIPNAAGCDSTITIALVVNNVNTSVTQSGPALTAIATGVSYQWMDCNTGAIIPGAINQGYTATANGSYACIITQNTCVDTSNCLNVTGIGMAENAFASTISLYPNPSLGNFEINLGATYANVTVTVTDIAGRVVLSQQVSNTNLIPMQLNEAAGAYQITINADGNSAAIRLIKE